MQRADVLYSICPGTPDDARAIAALHADSWRTAYRGLLPDSFLDGPVIDERLRYWIARMPAPDAPRRRLFKAVSDRTIIGFACVALDAEPQWGALVDNLHVQPDVKRQGIGTRLFAEARAWVADAAPGVPMHLTVIEKNVNARRFYDRLGGRIVERKTVEVIPGTPLAILRYLWEAQVRTSANLTR